MRTGADRAARRVGRQGPPQVGFDRPERLYLKGRAELIETDQAGLSLLA
ncbi:hypothetical protein ACTODO_01219 [Schaalia dentiphila ATCC 17982]|uniref:Uncharacterized protein n=1 Tax=Schaalia dentiphila ATCC 17982 TaxID=411466 RepID=A7BC41_9ACTO|nr:hypothetical protein ACTODO_01219 [Schaalia odontolytica ATCC 17982]